KVFLRKKEHLARITQPRADFVGQQLGSGGNSSMSETFGIACPHPRRPAVDSGTHHGGGCGPAAFPNNALASPAAPCDGLSGGVPMKPMSIHRAHLRRPPAVTGGTVARANSCSRGHGAVAAPSRPVSLSLAL